MKAGLRKHKRPIRNMIPSLCGFHCKRSKKLSLFAVYLENLVLKPYETLHHFNLFNLDFNIYLNEKKLSSTFFTRVSDVQNLTTSVIELHWKLETQLMPFYFIDDCSGKSNTAWTYFFFGILIYTH